MIARQKLSKKERKNLIKGLLFISPWIIGFLVFSVYPTVYSIGLSFVRYSGFLPPVWLGLQNYQRLISDDLFWQSLYNTLYYAAFAVPIGIVVAIVLALAMNRNVKEVGIYRAAVYMPSIIPPFALALTYIVLINPQYGLFTYLLSFLGVPQTNYLSDPNSAKLVIVSLAQYGAGGTALIFLAGIRSIPQTLYDAARIDGANRLQCFFRITLPLLSPVILFALITGLTGAMQVFDPAFIITGGGPNNGTLFYIFYLYRTAFLYAQLGYASALAFVLFIIGLLLALLIYRLSQRYVNYELVS
ncbi:sugar ABC transporter permease [Reticulibacter mediterranei]|uniref:Sugar ABC transporter permease n=1 Tax=Reticulibacter mediterranei TaxID=2778369 RepID=A0A8J3IN51_9CHLR|nr:sugar ABC transporter permease [Reticulibacter mediterranei]GHO97616.1 sugar ABC transporter permease [Reticulibacter mediterranei]